MVVVGKGLLGAARVCDAVAVLSPHLLEAAANRGLRTTAVPWSISRKLTAASCDSDCAVPSISFSPPSSPPLPLSPLEPARRVDGHHRHRSGCCRSAPRGDRRGADRVDEPERQPRHCGHVGGARDGGGGGGASSPAGHPSRGGARAQRRHVGAGGEPPAGAPGYRELEFGVE